MIENNSTYKSLWSLTISLCNQAQIPQYRKRNDPKVFTTQQKLFLYLYKIKKKLVLRELIEDLKISKVTKFLKLKRIPNFSTLSYFIKNIPAEWIDKIFQFLERDFTRSERIIIDSTGFECTHPSHYYCNRIDKQVDGFITLYAIIDQKTGQFRSFIVSEKKYHDSKLVKPLVERLEGIIKIFYGDRGFDSEENCRYLIEEKDCFPLILQKNMLKPVENCKGDYRLMVREVFDYGEYLKRNKIEAIFSALKRKYGSSLSTRSVDKQKKELSLKVLLFNMDKKIKMIILIIIRKITFQQNLILIFLISIYKYLSFKQFFSFKISYF